MNNETFVIILFTAFLTLIIGLTLAIIGENPFDTLGGNVGALDNYLEI